MATTDFAQWVAGLEAKRAAKTAGSAGLDQLSGREDERGEENSGEDMAALTSAMKNQLGERTAEENLKELQQEMKLLRWHKLANEAALKAAIIKTKRLRNKEATSTGATRQLEKAAWMQQVIQEEQGKPLEVTEDFIRDYQAKEAIDDHRVEKDMKRHMTNLKRVKDNFEQRADLYQRNQAYKEKKQLLDKKAQAVSERKSLPPIAGLLPSNEPSTSVADLSMTSDSRAGGPLESGSKNMAKVVNSLDRLVELEKRISLLERDNDQEVAVASRKKVVFAKQRIAANATEPARTKYHVRVNRRVTREQPEHSQEGAFMTSLPAINKPSGPPSNLRKPNSQLVQYQGKNTPSRGAVGSTRTEQTSRVRGRLHGAKQQDAVVSRWLQSKSSASGSKALQSSGAASRSRQARSTSRTRSTSRARSTSRSTRSNSIASRTQTKSRALVTKTSGPQKIQAAKDRMKEFRDVRKQYDKKRDQMMRNLHGKSDGSVRRPTVIRKTGKHRGTTGATSTSKPSRGMVVRSVTRGNARLADVNPHKSIIANPSSTRTKKKALAGRNSAAVRATTSRQRTTASSSSSSSRRRSNSISRKSANGDRPISKRTTGEPKMPQLGLGLGVVGMSASNGH